MVTRYIGNCPVCEGDFRLHKLQMVHHGYKRPGHGSIEGDCPGVGLSPWELSPDGTIWYVEKRLKPRLDIVQRWLGRAQRGEITELHVEKYTGGWGRDRKYETITLTPVDGYTFRSELDGRVRRAEHELETLERDIARREQRIATWHEQPVRTEEEDMAIKAQASAASRAVRDQARATRQAKRDAIDAKQAAREQERRDLMSEYRAIFNALALDGSPEAIKEAKTQWIKMFKRRKKKAYLDFREPELGIDEALLALGLAAPNPHPHGMWQYRYSNEYAWEPR